MGKTIKTLSVIFHSLLFILLGVYFISGCFLAVPFVILLCFKRWMNIRVRRAVIGLAMVFLFFPGTVTVKKSEHPLAVKVLPVIYGYPSLELMEKYENNQLFLSGRPIYPFAPLWTVAVYF